MTVRTEEEARKTRCCGPSNCGDTLARGYRYCNTVECMAWRWGNPDETRGYCGLAGKPE